MLLDLLTNQIISHQPVNPMRAPSSACTLRAAKSEEEEEEEEEKREAKEGVRDEGKRCEEEERRDGDILL